MIKKILTQEEKEKKEQKRKIGLGILLGFIIVFSSLGYAFLNKDSNGNQNTSANYGGLKFVKTNGLWVTQINAKNLYFNYLPSEISNVSIDGNYNLANYYNQPVYFVNSGGAAQTLVNNLEGFALRIQSACLQGLTCSDSTLPRKTCSDNVFVFVEKNETSVYQSENCTYLSGDLLKAVDKLNYRFYNIA